MVILVTSVFASKKSTRNPLCFPLAVEPDAGSRSQEGYQGVPCDMNIRDSCSIRGQRNISLEPCTDNFTSCSRSTRIGTAIVTQRLLVCFAAQDHDERHLPLNQSDTMKEGKITYQIGESMVTWCVSPSDIESCTWWNIIVARNNRRVAEHELSVMVNTSLERDAPVARHAATWVSSR